MAKKRHGSAVHAPAAQAEKFCRTSRQMPGGSASSEQSACGIGGTLGSSRRCYGDTSGEKERLFGPSFMPEGRSLPHQETEAWPQLRTRNARVQYLQRLDFAKFYRLTPSGRTGVKPSSDGEGGRSYAALLAVCEPFAIFNESL